MGSYNTLVIGISAVGGGGKTATTKRLTEVLDDAVAVNFGDYENMNVHPDDYETWFVAGADYDECKTPVFASHLEALKSGWSVSYPVGNMTISPARHLVAYSPPLGRAHSDSRRFIDLMVLIDTPVDVVMAR